MTIKAIEYLKNLPTRLMYDRDGLALTEYLILLGLLTAAVIGAVLAFGGELVEESLLARGFFRLQAFDGVLQVFGNDGALRLLRAPTRAVPRSRCPDTTSPRHRGSRGSPIESSPV